MPRNAFSSRTVTTAAALAALALSVGCSSDSTRLDDNGKPTLDSTGHQDPPGKADGLAGGLG